MEQLLRRFDQTLTDDAGETYSVLLYGRSRPGNTWQGWLAFERADGTRIQTEVETTQPDADAIVYWGLGLTASYFEGALDRAKSRRSHDPTPVPAPAPVVGNDPGTRRERLADVERAVLACFASRKTSRLLTRDVFDALAYANADIVRAFEDLEKQGGLIVRFTEEGSDWVALTPAGDKQSHS